MWLHQIVPRFVQCVVVIKLNFKCARQEHKGVQIIIIYIPEEVGYSRLGTKHTKVKGNISRWVYVKTVAIALNRTQKQDFYTIFYVC